MIEVADLSVSFSGTPVLVGAELQLCPGRVTGLIGPNGSGKSTLLRAITGAVASTGTINIDGEDARRLSVSRRSRRIAVVAQDEQPTMAFTVREIVLLGRSSQQRPWSGWTQTDHRAAESAMARTGTTDLAERSVLDLSGGERQRVLIARALVQATPYLLLDEPTNHLDIHYQHQVLQIIRAALSHTASLVVLHDLNLAARYCDDVVLLDHGRIVAAGPVDEVIRPDLLEPIYGVRIRLVQDEGTPQLMMAPHPYDE